VRPLFVLQEQKESVRAIVPLSTVRQLIAGRPATGRNRDKSAIADQVDQNFHPHRHDDTLPSRRRRKGSVRFCAFRRPDPRDRMAAAVAWIRLLSNEKPRRHPKTQTGSFMLSPLTRLLHLEIQQRGTDFVPGVASFFAEYFWRRSAGHERRRHSVSVPPQRQDVCRPDPLIAFARVVS
jgi:hypothetical protein